MTAASGFAGLGLQIVWTQQCALWLGHETAAVLAVVAAFFGGLAFGALLLGPPIDRSQRPVRWYAACEVLIAMWSLGLALLIEPSSRWLIELTGAQPLPAWQWAVAFGGTFLLLLPATAAMGATLPAMERITAPWHRQGRSIGAIYAANTAGAVVGVLAAAFWLVPMLGLARTAGLCAALNLLCAVGASTLFPAQIAPQPVASRTGARGLPWLLAATGLLGIGYEVLVVRVLNQVAEDTVYTFAMLLAVYLVGSAAGAAIYQRGLSHTVDGDRLRNRLLATLASACLLGTASLWAAESVKGWLLQALPATMASALTAEAALALLAFGLPTVVMGALFSHLGTQARQAGIGFGRALGMNTLGAALAPALFGVLLLPLLGAKAALLLLVAGYLALASWRSWTRSWVWLPAAATALLASMAPPLAFIEVPDGGHIVSYAEGATASVSVVEDAQGVMRLRIDNRQQEGSSSSLLADARQAVLPLLLHPAPRHALFLGLGTGVTARAAAEDPRLQVDAVELLPEVIEASARFARPFDGGAANPRLRLLAADARRYVRAGNRRYDLIVADNFHPARSGSGALYTVEHFSAVRERLAKNGVFCQWLPLHQIDLDTLRSIVRAFITANPGAFAMLATNSLQTPVLGLVTRQDGSRFALPPLRQRLARAQWPRPPAAFGVDDTLALFGSFVAGPRALARFAGDAPTNTDDRPVVTYRAPRITYAPDSLPRDRLLALLQELRIRPDELLEPETDAAWTQRLAAYWQARDRFIELGRDVQPTPDAARMLDQVGAPLLQVLRTSPDFRPAYDPLLRMTAALSRSDPAAARDWLARLAQAQPARPEARQLLQQLQAADQPARAALP